MKKLLLILFCLPMLGFAQSVPQGINYQAVARDASGAVLMNQTLTIQFSVISDITTSAISWQETHSVNTNDYGLYTAIIGQGTTTTVGSSATFDVIDWGVSNHLLKVEVDFGGGIFVDMGTTAFMSVPYSMNVDPTDELQSLSISGDTLFISSSNYIILPTPAPTVLGCTDTTSVNYNSLANTDDGSCIVIGCTNALATNYNSLANTDDGSCIGVVAIGDTLGGGIVFYVDGNGGGLVVANINQTGAGGLGNPPAGAEWGCSGTLIGTGTAIGTGAQNTIAIEAGCTTPGTAADICANLTLGGYSDWFLPSQAELNEMVLNKGIINSIAIANGGTFLTNGIYWSSSEFDLNFAWNLDFFFGSQQFHDKSYNSNFQVRAVRAF